MKKFTSKLALVLCTFFIFQGLRAQTRSSDSLALVKLYQSTNGSNWTKKWDLTKSMDNWDGITLNNSTGRVSSIYISFNKVSGTLPDELGNLTALTALTINNTDIAGNIPKTLGNLKLLTNLNLRNNKMAGTIPTELGLMSNLTYLTLAANKFTGTIPLSIIALSKLNSLALNYNELSGTLPKELFQTTHIFSVYLTGNKFDNFEQPSIPTNNVMESLSLSNNNLSGIIPNWIFDLTKLKTLALEGNKFIGSVPAEIKRLTKLQVLWLNNTGLKVDIHKWSTLFPLLEDIRLTNCKIDTSISQSFVDNHPKLRFMDVTNCGVTQLPTFGSLNGWLKVSGNYLTYTDLEKNYNKTVSKGFYEYAPQKKYADSAYLVKKVGENIEMNGDAGGKDTKYKWYKNGVEVNGATASKLMIPSVKIADSGVYYCVATHDSLLNLFLTRNNIRLRVTSSGMSSTRQVKKSTITLYPNPASNQVYISGLKEKTTVNVLGKTGQKVFTAQVEQGQPLTLPHYLKGAHWILEVQSSNQPNAYHKIIVQ